MFSMGNDDCSMIGNGMTGSLEELIIQTLTGEKKNNLSQIMKDKEKLVVEICVSQLANRNNRNRCVRRM
jgi:hypothetical protein